MMPRRCAKSTALPLQTNPMSHEDRQRWNDRYRAGEYGGRTHPCALLENWVMRWGPPAAESRALDLACGAGRNAVFLASKGYRVDAIDISAEALSKGAARARETGVQVNWLERDLDELFEPPRDQSSVEQRYGLIIVVRYADLELVKRLPAWLLPGGRLLVEAHLGGPLFTEAVDDGDQGTVGGPRSDRFRLSPGALSAACEELEPLYQREALITDPDGRLMALSQYVGQATQSSG